MHLHKPTLSCKNRSHQAHCADTLTMRAQPAANTVYSFSAAMPVNTQPLCVGVYYDSESQLKTTQCGFAVSFLVTCTSVRSDKALWAAIYFSEAHVQWQLSHSTESQIACTANLSPKDRSALLWTKGQRSHWPSTHCSLWKWRLNACPNISHSNLRWLKQEHLVTLDLKVP